MLEERIGSERNVQTMKVKIFVGRGGKTLSDTSVIDKSSFVNVRQERRQERRPERQ